MARGIDIQPALHHGGRLRPQAERYGIALDQWLDLSTGINPCAYPVSLPAPCDWARLPECGDGLESAAARYYGCPALLAVAGTQAVIRALPYLRPRSRVIVPRPAYAEHARAWRQAGHQVLEVPVADIDRRVQDSDVLVLVHPGNPCGERFASDALARWRDVLAARGGWLVVDEAFMDATPEYSALPLCPAQGLMVLRSLGKFFGLAGVRVGFVFAEDAVLRALDDWLGPWCVAGPSRAAARQALTDAGWQDAMRRRLQERSHALGRLLQACGWPPAASTALFHWVPTPHAPWLHEQLAKRGIWTRLFTEPAGVRFGLPADATQDARLRDALLAVL